MLGMNDLRVGTFFVYEGNPWQVLEARHLKMQQRRPVMQTKIKNIINGKIIEKNFQQSDYFEEANVERKDITYLYNHRGEYWFSDPEKKGDRFTLPEESLGNQTKFLKANMEVNAITFNDKIINIELPIKIDLKVVEAPPSVKGNTAQGGTKQVKIETGATIIAPLFINEGDIVRINTSTGEYVERAEKN